MRVLKVQKFASSEAERAASDALAAMERLRIPPTPINFAVWFYYKLGDIPDLVNEMDRRVREGHSLTADEHLALFDRYLDIDPLDVEMAQAAYRVDESIAHLLELVAEAGGDAKAFAEMLDTSAKKLNRDTPAEVVSEVLATLIVQTGELRRKNEELTDQLHQASEEVHELRSSLMTAREQALLDTLTGVANRKAYDLYLERAAREAKKSGLPLSLLMIDIDHFKRFNDTFGHAMGDQVLRLVGQILRESLKGKDKATRYGGEEFAIILPNTSLDNAVRVANSLRQTVAAKKIMRKRTGQELARITLSAGVAQYAPGEPLADFQERADRALYLAKHYGRNRVMTEEHLHQAHLPTEQLAS